MEPLTKATRGRPRKVKLLNPPSVDSASPQMPQQEEPAYNASNPEHVAKARKKSAKKKKIEGEVIIALMGEEKGRKWLYELLRFCKVNATPFMHGSSDGTAFQCGMQKVGLMVLADVVKYSPDQYVTMCRENAS